MNTKLSNYLVLLLLEILFSNITNLLIISTCFTSSSFSLLPMLNIWKRSAKHRNGEKCRETTPALSLLLHNCKVEMKTSLSLIMMEKSFLIKLLFPIPISLYLKCFNCCYCNTLFSMLKATRLARVRKVALVQSVFLPIHTFRLWWSLMSWLETLELLIASFIRSFFYRVIINKITFHCVNYERKTITNADVDGKATSPPSSSSLSSSSGVI